MTEPKPFVKWAGGKRQLLSQLLQHSPSKFNEYYEPLLGGGALFFKLYALGRIKRAHLNDSSRALIMAYKTVKEKPNELISELKKDRYKNDKDTFYEIREKELDDLVKATARFIYLNKTAFNGLYRVNSKGKFNVPFGRYKNPKIVDEDNIVAVSKSLQRAELTNLDFEQAIKSAKRADFIYLDPPYHPLSTTSNFTGYTKEDFTEKDQVRLSIVFKELDGKGCYVLLSNSYSPFILGLYRGFNIRRVRATRMINCRAEGRGKINEALITNYSCYRPL